MSPTQALKVTLQLVISMDEIASNASERKRPKAPWPWGLLTGILLAVFILTSIAGLLVAIFGKKIVHPSISFYFQAVASIFAFFLTIAETGLLVSTVKWVEAKKQEQVKLLRSSVTLNSGRLPSTPDILSQQKVKEFNAARILLVYISFIGLNVGLILGFLSLNLVFVYDSHTSLRGTLWPFFVVDIVLGLMVPLMIGASLVPLAKTVRYVTNSKIETRKLFRWCLPCLGYEQGSKECYWVINDSFYLKINKEYCAGLNTVLVYFMSLAVFLNSWLYFVNSSITTQFGSSGCSLLSERDKFYMQCFDLLSDFGHTMRVNCSLNSSFDGTLFCLDFEGSSLIHGLVVSVVLYYITATCISVVFQVVRGLLFYAQTGVWSNLVILLGILLLFFGTSAFASNFYLQSNFDILGLLQLFSICTCIMIVGFLLKRGQSALMRTHQLGRDNIALTPVNPSEISVPVNDYASTMRVRAEVRSPSLTTDEGSCLHQLSAPPPPGSISSPSPSIPHVDTVPNIVAASLPTDNSDTMSLPPNLSGQENLPGAVQPRQHQQLHHLQRGVLTNSQRRETAPALVGNDRLNKRKVTIL